MQGYENVLEYRVSRVRGFIKDLLTVVDEMHEPYEKDKRDKNCNFHRIEILTLVGVVVYVSIGYL